MANSAFSVAIILALSCFYATNAGDDTYSNVCYEGLGCFSTGPPFNAAGRIALLPDSPSKINVKFFLYTRKNVDRADQLSSTDVNALYSSHYYGLNPTKIIVHGFLDSPALGPWMTDMAKQFLVSEECNAIVVDWSTGGQTAYAQAVANARVVGAQIAQLINLLKNEVGPSTSKFHILGHNVGAHIAGYAGQNVTGLGRITGMDPADFYFTNTSTVVRLDEGDATFVDVVHTDASDISSVLNPFNNQNGLGIWQPSGHVDVYPNGGKQQPGCGSHGPLSELLQSGLIVGSRNILACAAVRSYEYVHETISSSCPWRVYRCDSGYNEFKSGRCLRCPTSGDKTKSCNSMGKVATQPSDGSVNNIYWSLTGDKSPYCRYHFHVQLVISGEQRNQQKGKVWVKLIGDQSTTGYLQLGDAAFYITGAASYDFLVTSVKDLGTIETVDIKWEYDAAWWQWQWGKPSIIPKHVGVFSGEHQTDYKFCSDGEELDSKDSRQLKSC